MIKTYSYQVQEDTYKLYKLTILIMTDIEHSTYVIDIMVLYYVMIT